MQAVGSRDKIASMKYQGLSEQEAQKRLLKEGFNELPTRQRRHFLLIAAEVAREPMFLLLVACGVIYLFLGDIYEALVLLFFVFIIMGLTIFQENKTERTLETLRDLSSPRGLVIRGGVEKRIPGREVVREDIVILEEGDRVPADCYVLESGELLIDESLLTGESAAVGKKNWQGENHNIHPGGEDLPFVYSGTMIVRGQGIGQVYATGVHTQLGKIGQSLEKVKIENTPLQKQTEKLVRNIALICLVICAAVIVFYYLRFGNWLKGFLAGLTLAMSILPEEIPVVLVIFLALGAWRIAQKKVLTRRIPVIETLGAATVLAVDKTGTLTLNQMQVQSLFADGEFIEVGQQVPDNLGAKFVELIKFSVLSSEIIPLDPMEKAFHQLGQQILENYFTDFYNEYNLTKDYGFSRKLMATTHIWKKRTGSPRAVVAAKGAAEAIFDLCHLTDEGKEKFKEKINFMALNGLRVLAVASGNFEGDRIPEIQHDLHFEFLGLIGLSDPARPKVKESIEECRQAGIRVAMITGDYPVTAQAIGYQIGLKNPQNFLTGPDIRNLTEAELKEKVKDTNIFARVIPEQKLKLVEALKKEGEIVAMTGDGVNDAPALKAAHIGIAMGERGTDVAREASSLVLLNDTFSSIVAAIREGRRIFDNIKKALAYTFAIHVPIAGLAFFPLLFKWPMIFAPVHIVFLELVIDPACSFVFEMEPAESNVMKRPPRPPSAPLFSRKIISLSVLQGMAVLLVLLFFYGWVLARGWPELKARAIIFSGLVLANLGLIVNNSSFERGFLRSLRVINKSFWLIAALALAFLILVLYSPLNQLFKMSPLNLPEMAVVFLAAAVGLLLAQGLKFLNKYLGD